MRLHGLVLLLVLTGCSGDEEKNIKGTLDYRVDHAGEDDEISSNRPRLCLGADNNYAVVWQDSRTGVDAIWFNRTTTAGEDWEPSDNLINRGSAVANQPEQACAGSQVWVVWQDERIGALRNPSVFLNRSQDGGLVWQATDIHMDEDPDGLAVSINPTISNVDDDVYVVWQDGQDGAHDIYLQRSPDGGTTWQDDPIRVDTDPAGDAYSGKPIVAADAEGHVVVVWEERRAGGIDIQANASADGGVTWGLQDVRLDGPDDPGFADSTSPQVLFSGSRVFVLWTDHRSGAKGEALLNVSEDYGNSWLAEPLRISDTAGGQFDEANPKMAADGATLHLAWQDDRAGANNVYYRKFDAQTGEFTGPSVHVDVDGEDVAATQSYEPQLRVSGATVLVGWLDRRNDSEFSGHNDLFYRYSEDGGETWSEQDYPINSNRPASANLTEMSLLLNGDSYAAVWTDDRNKINGPTDIYFASRKLGEAGVFPGDDE